MNIPYRTRRVLNRVGTVLLVLLLVGILAWLCWVVWLERYVVYSDEGATLDFNLSAQDISGEVAVPPVAQSNVSIYYNEGSDAIETSNDLTQLNGYYIDSDMLQTGIAGVLEDIEKLSSGTPVMIELKAGYGSFYYTSSLEDAIQSQSIPVATVDELIQKMQDKDFYTIAKISAFRDYNFGLNHVSSGLYMLSRAGLWSDDGGCYWLDPTNSTTLTWISSIVVELRDMGFDEVLLSDFRFPDSTQYIFSDDKDAALLGAATTLLANCGTSDFTLSFSVDSPTFALPDGRCRMYLANVAAQNVEAKAAQVTISDPDVRLVFIADTNDTRYDNYGVLRSLAVSDVLEAQKADNAS